MKSKIPRVPIHAPPSKSWAYPTPRHSHSGRQSRRTHATAYGLRLSRMHFHTRRKLSPSLHRSFPHPASLAFGLDRADLSPEFFALGLPTQARLPGSRSKDCPGGHRACTCLNCQGNPAGRVPARGVLRVLQPEAKAKAPHLYARPAQRAKSTCRRFFSSLSPSL